MYGFGFYRFDGTYILVLIGVVLSMLASSKVKSTFNKYSRVRSMAGITGAEAAERILRQSGIYDVRIEHISGNLTDHYDPSSKVLRLSDSVYGSTSVAAIGVAAHECGHAVQHQVGYVPLSIRSALVPVANFGSSLSWPIFVAGLIFSIGPLLDIGIILFLAAVTIELSKLLEFNPVPMILSEIFCANLGGSATMCGDPPNIIIGTSLGFTFMDFIKNTGLIAVIALVLVVIYFYFIFHKELEKNGAAKKDPSQYPDPAEAITSKGGFIASSVIFLCAVVLLVTHAQTGLTVSTIGVCIAAATLIAAGKEGPGLLKKIDYQTLLFFIGLFVVVGGLEQTGVLKILAGIIEKVSGGNIALMIAIIVIVSAVASAFIDNIPFAATMIPVITNLAATTPGIDITVLSWALAMGTDIGGSATPIGASANVVGIATAAKEGHIIKWGKYCKAMAPATVIVIAVSLVMIYVRYL